MGGVLDPEPGNWGLEKTIGAWKYPGKNKGNIVDFEKKQQLVLVKMEMARHLESWKIPTNQLSLMKNPTFTKPDFLDTIRVFALKMVGKRKQCSPNGYLIVIYHGRK